MSTYAQPAPQPQRPGMSTTKLFLVIFGPIVATVALLAVVAYIARPEPAVTGGGKASDVSITKCSAGGTGGLVEVDYSVTNSASRPRGYRLSIAYRDSSDTRLGDTTEIVRSVAPGETARGQARIVVSDSDAWGSGRCVLARVS